MADPTREAAFDLLSAVLDRRRPLEEALDALPPLEPRDRAAAHRLAAMVLRRTGTLDAVLEPYLRREPPAPARLVLRIGAAGLLLLNTPSHAAVATAVALARTRGLTPFAGLVNAVLRRVAETGGAALTELDAPRLDTPSWLWASWGTDARAIATAHQHEAPLDLTLGPGITLDLGGGARTTPEPRHETAPARAPAATDAGFSPPDVGFPSPAGGFPSPAAGFPSPAGGFPSPAAGFPSPAGGFPSPAGGFPSPAGGFPSPVIAGLDPAIPGGISATPRSASAATGHATIGMTPRAGTLPAPHVLPTGSVRYPTGTHVTDVPGFAEGRLWVQDAAAALPAALLAVRRTERVADLCAAPGGKTGQLAASGAQVTALERDPARLARLAENLHRWGLAADLVQADATAWTPTAQFDAVLLDAPCSATGTIRRHPDIPHLKRPRDVRALTEAQDALLTAAIAMLRPGGRLIYAVCSLQPEEAEPRITAALARGGVRHDPFTPADLPNLPEAITPAGFLRTHPGIWAERGGMDGFFAARLIRA